MEKIKRNSNIELLRILCLIAIIIHHSFCHSNLQPNFNNINYNILYIIQILGKVANNIFVLITGYYMVDKKMKKKSIFRLIFKTLFYSYSILIIYIIVTNKPDALTIIKSAIPIMSNSNWFVTAYLLLYLSIPIINLLLDKLNKEQLSKVIIGLLLCFSILPSITLLTEYFSVYIWFICLYMIGAFIKKYDFEISLKNSNIMLILSSILYIFIKCFIRKLKIDYFNISDINNFILFIISFSIFIKFIKKKEWYNSKVNYMASTVLGIYLIHDNIIVRPFIWKMFNIGNYITSDCFWLYEISIVIFIFCSCFIIEKILQYFIDNLLFNYIENKIKNRKREIK